MHGSKADWLGYMRGPDPLAMCDLKPSRRVELMIYHLRCDDVRFLTRHGPTLSLVLGGRECANVSARGQRTLRDGLAAVARCTLHRLCSQRSRPAFCSSLPSIYFPTSSTFVKSKHAAPKPCPPAHSWALASPDWAEAQTAPLASRPAGKRRGKQRLFFF